MNETDIPCDDCGYNLFKNGDRLTCAYCHVDGGPAYARLLAEIMEG